MSTNNYRADIDGLRAIAVSSVVAFHAFPERLKGGFIGVDIFFVISGFLISTIIFKELEAGKFKFSGFYTRRVRRIFPALIIVLICSLAFGWLVLLPDELNQLGKHVAAGAAFSSNLVLWSEAGYFDVDAAMKPLLHLWSLGIEEQFYIVWPFVLWLAWKSKFNILALTCVIALMSFLLNLNLVHREPTATFYSPQTRIWELMSGSILAWLLLYKSESLSHVLLRIDRSVCKFLGKAGVNADGVILANLASFAGFGLLVLGFILIEKELAFPGMWALVPVLGAFLIICAGPMAWFNRVILSHKWLVWIGLLSFPLYLWHWPILSFAHIIEGEPDRALRVSAVLLSFLLAWATMRLIEKPFRFGGEGTLKAATLCGGMLVLGVSGVVLSQKDLTQSHRYENLLIGREGFELGTGASTKWFQGKDDWLFLGNSYSRTVEKLKLTFKPEEADIAAVAAAFSRAATAGAKNGTRVALIIGPDKPSVYPEFLPDSVTPSPVRYIGFFLDALGRIPNLSVYDPRNDLLSAKGTEGLLYSRTGTHWNNKGAYIAYLGLMTSLGLPGPSVDFEQGGLYRGELIDISGLKDFPLHAADNWDIVWKHRPVSTVVPIEGERETPFGKVTVVKTDSPLSSKYVWVIGDSFTAALRQYFDATFGEVHYLGHWSDKLASLPDILESATRKPDIIFVIKVERSF